MARPKYKPGSRKINFDGNYSPAREAWVKTLAGECVLFDMNFAADETQERDALLVKCRNGRSTWGFNLHRLTVEELDKLREFFNYAFDRARPFCEAADHKAQEELERGIATNERIYRQTPQFVVLPREVRLNDPRLRERSDGVSEMGTGALDGAGDAGELRSDGNGMAQPASEDVGTEDDGASADQSSDVGTLGKVAGGGTC